MIGKDTVLKGPRNYKVKERGNARIFLNPMSGAWFRTNSTGASILTRLDGRSTVAEVLHSLADEYGMTEDYMEAEVIPFFEDAVEHGICKCIDVANTPSNMTPSRDTGTPFLHLPKELWIHPHARCNLHCPYCYNYKGASSVKEGCLEIDHLKPFVEYIKAKQDERAKLSVVISGGEPMLWLDKTLEIVRYLKESDICRNICLLSNGTVGSEEDWRQVLSLINVVQFALDGSNQYMNDSTRSKGSFNKTVGTIKMIRSIYPDFQINLRFTVTAQNCFDMSAFVNLASDLQVNRVVFCSVVPHGRGSLNQEIIPSTDRVMQALGVMKHTYKVLRLQGKLNNMELSPGSLDPVWRLGSGMKRKGCGAGFYSILIAENGNIYPCVSMQESEFLLGNLLKDTPSELLARCKPWADEITVDSIQFCKDCDLRYICGGTCIANNWLLTGNVRGVDNARIDETTGKCKWHDAIEERMWSFPDYQSQRIYKQSQALQAQPKQACHEE